MKLFLRTALGSLDLRNRVVMAPMTRSRAIGNLANDLMADYYAARAGARKVLRELDPTKLYTPGAEGYTELTA